MLISLQSTMEFIEKAKGKLALIFNGSWFSPSIGGWTMEYATGDAQKGPVLLESPLKGMISNNKLHHAIMLCM